MSNLVFGTRTLKFKSGTTYTFNRPMPLLGLDGWVIDLNGATVVAGASFAGPGLFDASGTTRVTLRGPGTLDGFNHAVNAFSGSSTTKEFAVENLTLYRTIGHLIGGNRRAMIHGNNRVVGCRFNQAGLAMAGVRPLVRGCTFTESVEKAIQIGIPPLEWDEIDVLSANGFMIEDCDFNGCYTSGTGTTDDGVLYMGRDFTSDGYINNVRFNACKAVSLYVDDMFSNLTATNLQWNANVGRDFLVGGGRNVHLQGVSTNAGQASIWDDRGNKDSLMRTPGSPPSGGLSWHGLFHEGTSGVTAWNHGGVIGLSNLQRMVIVNDAINAEGAEAWLARMNEIGDYTDLWTNEATYRTSGSVNYARNGTTPEILVDNLVDGTEVSIVQTA